MIDMTLKTNTIEMISSSSIRITIPKEIRNSLGVDTGDYLYVGLPDKELQELAILEISTEKVASIEGTKIANSGRIVIDNNLSNLVEINNYKKIGFVLTNKKLFLFLTDAMKKDVKKEEEYTGEERKGILEKATMIAEIVAKTYK